MDTGRTDDETMNALLVARQINLALGGAFVSPDEVGMLSDDLVLAVQALGQLREFGQARQRVQDTQARIRERWRDHGTKRT